MLDNQFITRSILDSISGLRDGLSRFSLQQCRVALALALTPTSPMLVIDPQNLLQGHKIKFRELYLTATGWRHPLGLAELAARPGHLEPEGNLGLAGLISQGGRSSSVFYQMWFTEHHPDMCAIGPTERWLEYAARRLAIDFHNNSNFYTGISGNFLREYANHAVRAEVRKRVEQELGPTSALEIGAILEAILAISKTPEEGAWPRGRLVFVEPAVLGKIEFIARFPEQERPELANYGHARKLLQAVENSPRELVSDGRHIVGVSRSKGVLPFFSLTAEFMGRRGFVEVHNERVCSFSDRSFHSSNYHTTLVLVEELLLESDLDPTKANQLLRIIDRLVHHARKQKHGCTLVIDLNQPPVTISGQNLAVPLDLTREPLLALAESLAKVDGALHIGGDLTLLGFACLLDGRSIPCENRARGARFNSALRFSADHENIIVVVISADRPVSIVQSGVALEAKSEWQPPAESSRPFPTLTTWLSREE